VFVLARCLYVSDVDVEMSKDVESLRIDRHLVSDLSSLVPGRKRRMLDRIEEHGRKKPMAIVPVLLKYYDHDHPKVRNQVRESLARLMQSEAGELAVIESVFSKNREVARSAATMLERKNYHSLSLLSAFTQVENLVGQARKADVFCQDIEELVADSIDTYKEGRFEQALTNMLMAKELMDDRLEWHSHVRSYVKDVLRLTPVLGRSGVQIDAIQDSLRSATSAVQSRRYDDARMLLDLRREETRIWKQLWSLLEFISRRVKAKPDAGQASMKDPDRKVLEAFLQMAGEVEEKTQDRDMIGALRRVERFIRDDVSSDYLAGEGKRLDSNDESASHIMWSTGLGVLKVLAPVIPNVAEEFYQQYYRDAEGAPSIHTSEWPEPFASHGKASEASPKSAQKASEKLSSEKKKTRK